MDLPQFEATPLANGHVQVHLIDRAVVVNLDKAEAMSEKLALAVEVARRAKEEG